MYDTETPFRKSLITLQEYHGGIARGLVNKDAVKVHVEVERACSCSRFLYLPGQERQIGQVRCLVLIDESQEHASGKRYSGKHIDLWEHTQGEWFYVASFWGDRCRRD
jgi:ribulose-5-phosphate 4-epimerase/fuculose-1-phosphate aldolase